MNERFEGIVLFKRKYREHDALVKIFTSDFGTRMFFVKRLETPNHPLASQLVPLTINDYIGTINLDGLSFLKEASTEAFNRKVQEDFMAQAYAAYVSQLVDAAVDDNVSNKKLYETFKLALQQMNLGKAPEVITTYMEIYLLPDFGTHIQWQQCVVCGSSQQPFDFSLRKQGVLCQQHFHEDDFRLRISPRAMYVASILAKAELTQIQSVNVSAETLINIRRLMDEIYQEFVGLRLRSKSYLDQMLEANQTMSALLDKRKSTDDK